MHFKVLLFNCFDTVKAFKGKTWSQISRERMGIRILKGAMKQVLLILTILLVIVSSPARAQKAEVEPMLSTEPEQPAEPAKVTAVYGVTAEDYLPSVETARKHLRPNVRTPASRPSFDLPDAFYFIGGPVFLMLLLRVLVIFLNGFEEKRREEERAAASEKASVE